MIFSPIDISQGNSVRNLMAQAQAQNGMHIKNLSFSAICEQGTFWTLKTASNRQCAIFSVSRRETYNVLANGHITDMCKKNVEVYEFGSWFVLPEYRGLGLLEKVIEFSEQVACNADVFVAGVRTADVGKVTSIHAEALPVVRQLINSGFNIAGLDPKDLGLRFFKQACRR